MSFLRYTEKNNFIYRHFFILFYFRHIIINKNGKSGKCRQDKKNLNLFMMMRMWAVAQGNHLGLLASPCYIYVSYVDISLWMLYIRYERNNIYINAFEKRFCIVEELGFYDVFLNDCRNYFEQRRYWAYRFVKLYTKTRD